MVCVLQNKPLMRPYSCKLENNHMIVNKYFCTEILYSIYSYIVYMYSNPL